MIKVELLLMAQRHHHGGKPVQQRAVKAAAVSKFKKLLQVTPEGERLEQSTPDKTDVRKAKPYGSHSGGTHIGEILSFEAPDGKVRESDLIRLQNVCNTFEGFSSIDIKSMKAKHAEDREKLNKKYRDQYGDHLSQKQMTSFKNEYAKLSFVYWTQQVLIKVTSTEPLDGARKTPEGSYVVVLKTKTVFTLEMISAKQLEALKKVGEGQLSSEARVFTSITRTGGVFTVDHNGKLRLVPDKGNLLDLTDQY